MTYFKKYIIIFVVFVFAFIISLQITMAAEVTVELTLAINPGELTLTSSSTAVFAEVTASGVNESAAGSIENVNVIDTRGTRVGWTATMTSTHFTTMSEVKFLSENNYTGTNTDVDFIGTYDGLDGVLDPVRRFLVEITQAGTVGTAAVFRWTDPLGNETTGVLTDTSVSLSNGISVTFANTNYAVGDKWFVLVDVLPYTGLTVNPGDIGVNSGSLYGITNGLSGTLTGSGINSDAFALMTADSFTGSGSYYQEVDLNLIIHNNSLSGLFTAQANITVS